MRNLKRSFLVFLVFLTVLSLVLSACGPVDNGNGKDNNGNKNGKDKNGNKNGKDKTGVDDGDKGKTSSAEKITICHKTGNAEKPYKEITIAKDAAESGHASHEGDIIPAPAGGCPEK